MIRPLTMALAFAAGLLSQGCGLMHGGGIDLVGHVREVIADDGATLIAYDVTERGRENDEGLPRALLFHIPGSAPQSVVGSMGRLAGVAAAGLPLILLERRGIDITGAVDMDAFRAGSTREGRIADVLRVLRDYLAHLPPDVPVILLGASEGGEVAAAVAAREPRVSHLILIGTGGGWTQEREIRHFIATAPPFLGLSTQAEFDAVLAAIDADPESTKEWAGNPYRRWSTFLRAAPVDDLLRSRAGVFSAHGTADRSVPLESARALRDACAAAGRDDFTHFEVPGADHSFRETGTGRDLGPLVEVALVRWFRDEGFLTAEEAETLVARVMANHGELDDR